MSSNESVERMLKQLENLLRQQDKDQSRETGAEPEAVAADGGSPVLSEEQASGDLPSTPVVEVADNVESEASVDEAREPAYRATGDPVPVGMSGAQGLNVEMVPSEEDWHEIGESELAEAGVNLEQVPAASETQVEVDTHSGPGLDSGGIAEVGTIEVGVPPIEVGVPPVEEAAGVELSAEQPSPDALAIEDTPDVAIPVEASPPDPAEILQDGADDPDEWPHRRRRFSIDDLLNPSNHDEEQTAEEGSSAQEAPVPATDNGQAELADEPREISADGLVDAPGEMGEPQATGGAMSASGPHGETGTEELPASAEGIINAKAEAESVPPAGDVQEGLQASPDSSADTEPSEDGESPTSKYPSWWFRGGSVHRMEEGEDPGTPEGSGSVEPKDDRPNLEPFVHREPEVGPPPARKLISEQMEEEEIAAERRASEEREADEDSGTPGEVIIGIEGLNGVPAPPDAVPVEEPEVAEVIENASEDVVDPAKALKIVESFAEVAAPQDAGAAEEAAHIEETAHIEEAARIEEAAHIEETAHIEEAARIEEAAHTEEAAHIEKAAHIEEAAHAAEIEAVAEVAPSDEGSLADGESTSIDEIVVQDEDSAMVGGALDEEVTDPLADGPQISVIIDEEGSTTPEVEPGPVAPMAEQPAAKQPEVEIPQAEVPEIMATNAEVPPVEVLEPETPQNEIPDSPIGSTPAADSMSERPRRRLTARLGTLLLDAHLISGRDLERALEEHQVTGERLGHYLVDKGMVDEKDLAAVLSDQYGVPAADVENLAVPAAALMLIPEKMARRRMVLPLAVGEGVIEVAMINPSDIAAIEDIEFITGLSVQPLIVTEWALERAIQRLYSSEDLRSARLSGVSAKSTGLTDPKAIIRRMVRDRDEAVMQSESDPQSAYELAASIDDFVDEILKVVEKLQE